MAAGFESRTRRVALGGILTAGSLSVLYLASVAPSARLGISAVAGLFPLLALLRAGRSAGYLVWGATSILGAILLPEKAIVLCYLALFGLYPMLKSEFEKLQSRILSWICKLFYGVLGTALLQKFLLRLLMREVPLWMSRRFYLLFLMGIVVFIVYDIGLSRLILVLKNRLVGRRPQ